MELALPTVLVAVVWIVVSTTLIALGIYFTSSRKALGIGLLAGGLVVLLSPLTYVVYAVSPLSNPTEIWVEGFEPAKDPGVTVHLRHTRDFENGTEYSFGNAGDPQHVTEAFQEQHPNGVVTRDEPAGPLGQSVWHMSTASARYDLMYTPHPDWYHLALQVVVLHPVGNGADLRIPFPRSALDITSITEGEPYVNAWTLDQWTDFYRDITAARVSGSTITVVSAQGPTATITVDNGAATVAIRD